MTKTEFDAIFIAAGVSNQKLIDMWWMARQATGIAPTETDVHRLVQKTKDSLKRLGREGEL